MLRTTSRVFVLTGTLLSAVLMAPAVGQAQGLFDWLGCGSTRTAYSPVVAAPNACNPCQTAAVTYVPRTSYRLGFVDVPVTRMRPVASCDPCTGTAVTAYRPTTEYVKRLRFVPQTTYRAVTVPTRVAYAPAAACNTCPTTVGYAAPGCSSCGTAAATPSAYYSPTAGYAAPGCSSCGTAAPAMTSYTAPAQTYTPSPAPAASYTQPAPTYTQAAPTYTQPAPSQVTPAPTYTQPAPSQSPAETGEPRTFKRLESTTPSVLEQGPELQPIPDSTKGAPSLFRAPQLVDPQDQTAQSGATSWKVAKAVHVQTAEPTQEELDADGWRAAK